MAMCHILSGLPFFSWLEVSGLLPWQRSGLVAWHCPGVGGDTPYGCFTAAFPCPTVDGLFRHCHGSLYYRLYHLCLSGRSDVPEGLPAV